MPEFSPHFNKKGRRPSVEYINPEVPKRTLRPWSDVCKMYTEKTGLPMTEANARDIAIRAFEKLRKELNKRGNAHVKKLFITSIAD
jgi:hypothetical protein